MPTNRLASEKSPYLLQHAHNPVDWYPWGEEAFRKAREEDKPIFLSVGYSTCHWCHVMERESFESEEIAVQLNRDFVPIKVDREERPDVDRVYMLFVQATTGSGGWPMSVWLTPSLKPFFGGTYFPPDNRYGRPGFPHVLNQIAEAWRNQRDKLLTSSESILEDLRNHARVEQSETTIDPNAIEAAFHYLRRTYDSRFGGFGSAPKFPRPVVFNFLFRYFEHSGNEEARDMALHTLREMAKGGMYDHLGGGFHRYSVDEQWFVPHFEKMLYDQAQLVNSYLEAFQLTGDTQYTAVVKEVLEYVLRDMTHPEGGFYSAEDADSIIDPAKPHEKGEGAFYIWSRQELDSILGEEMADIFSYRYGVDEEGNVRNDPHEEFTGKNILFEANTLAGTARHFNLTLDEVSARLASAEQRLLQIRSKRPRPHLDDKVLSAWNGLMISAFARAAQIFPSIDNEAAIRYQNAALRAAHFLLDRLYNPSTGNLLRRWREGEPAVSGFLDDYAFTANAFLDLYETTFNADWLEFAHKIVLRMIELFEDRQHGAFFSTTQESQDIVLRLKEDYDGAEPSGNSIAVTVLLRLAQFMGDNDIMEAAEEALKAFASRINQQSITVPQMLAAWLYYSQPKEQLVIAGPLEDETTQAFLAEARARFRPNAITLLIESDATRDRLAHWNPMLREMRQVDGRPAAYLCENFSCQLPVTQTPIWKQ